MARLNTREQQLQRSKPVNYSIERTKQINKERHKIPVSSAVISPFLVTFMLQGGGNYGSSSFNKKVAYNDHFEHGDKPAIGTSDFSVLFSLSSTGKTCERQPSDFLAAPFRQYKQVLFG